MSLWIRLVLVSVAGFGITAATWAPRASGASRTRGCSDLLASSPSPGISVEAAIAEAWVELLTKNRVPNERELEWMGSLVEDDPGACCLPEGGIFDFSIHESLAQLRGVTESLIENGAVDSRILYSEIISRARAVISDALLIRQTEQEAAMLRSRSKPITVLVGHLQGVAAAQFSPDGDKVVTASLDGSARIWDLEHFESVGAQGGAP